jgi:hypothetical protein
MMHLATETFAQVRDEIEDLIVMHYDEIASDKHVIKLDPDWGKYESMERDNALRIFTARKDGKLVGYSVFFLVWHPHYKQNLFAQNDIVFLHPDHRGGTGVRLIRYSEEQLRKDRVDKLVWHAKPDTALSQLLPKMGYIVQDIILGKVL